MKKLQILMATYNGEKFINEQLESIINQTYTDWELLIRDDFSSDRTPDILNHYRNIYPEKISIIANKNIRLGVVNNFKELINHSNAEYLMFSDQDDVWFPDKIEKTLNSMLHLERSAGFNKPFLVHTDLSVTDEKLKILAPSMLRLQKINPEYKTLNRLIIQNNVTGCTMMVNRCLGEMLKSLPNDIVMHDWWTALIASCFGSISFLNEATILYRQHTSNEIGVKKYNFNYIYNKFQHKESIKSGIGRACKQADLFLEHFINLLSYEQKLLLKEFSGIDKMGKFEKRFFLINNAILKFGFLRNVGLLLYI